MPQGRDTRFDPRRSVGRERWESTSGIEFTDGGPNTIGVDGESGWAASAVPTEDGRFEAQFEAGDPTEVADAAIYGGSPTHEFTVPMSYRTSARALTAGQVLGERISGQREVKRGKSYGHGMRPGNDPT